MAGIVPSRAVSTITKLFPDATDGRPGNFTVHAMADVRGVLTIIAKIPEELLILNEEDYANYAVALSELQIISEWLIAKGKPEPEETQPAWNYGARGTPCRPHRERFGEVSR
jgi:hypothetical protein